MSVSLDLDFQNLSTVQSNLQQFPVTIASATTAITIITKLTFLTGTAQVGIITPPSSGYAEITLCFTNASPGAFTTGGNIQRAAQPVQNVPLTLYYDPSSAKWWVGPVSGVV